MLKHDWIEIVNDRLAKFALFKPRQRESLPILLDRRRIYVLPTAFGVFIGIVIAAMLIGALNYNNNPGLLMAFLLAALANNSLIQAHLKLSGIELHSCTAEPVHAGQPVELIIHCHISQGNRPRDGIEWLPPAQTDCFIDPSINVSQVLIKLETQRRGWLQIPRLRLSTIQPYGLARAWSWLLLKQSVLVYPSVERNGPVLPQHFSDESGRLVVRTSSDEPQHLRQYRAGDPQRLIAWKASAKSEQLLVREYQSGEAREIALDWFDLVNLDYEQRISRLTHWVLEADRQGINFSMHLPHVQLGPAQGATHRQLCLRELALMPYE